MGKIGIVYMIIGIVAILGAAISAFFLINLASAMNIINSADTSQLPPDTDLTAIQESMGYLNLLLTLGSSWIISVFLAGLICMQAGVRALRTRTKTMR